ncbi:MAG: ABC transporter substrate-binding protein [Chloroflexota bacterium]|nr:ABC transporter substrate-binding protein [Chloroflexota bacterium]
MNYKRLSLIAILLLALGVVLAACGGGTAPEAGAPAEEAVETVEEAVEPEAEEAVEEAAEPEAEEVAEAGEAEACIGDPVETVEVLSNVQAADPIEFETARLFVENLRQLGVPAEHVPMPWEQQADRVWYDRENWQATAWRMVGRPERMDPDEFVVNLFSSDTAESGYNFVGYTNPEYDEVAQAQRAITDPDERQPLIYEAQEIIAQDVPYIFVAHPQLPFAFRTDVWNPDSIVDAKGIGIKNTWTFIQAEPVGDEKRFILNTGDVIQAINPLFISGAADSWITELIWDRLMRVGPDGLVQPWAAESVEWEDDTNVLVTLRDGMTWHDGEPVTVEDVVFSFQATTSGEAPMYAPFGEKIENIEIVDERMLRFTLTEPWAAFETASLAKINLIPQHIWEPILEDLASKEENAESYQEEVPIGSGPYRFVGWKPSEEVILEANPDHFAAPKAEGWVLRIIPNVESALGQLRNGEINFLSEWEGDPTILAQVAEEDPNIEMVATTELGFRFFALNNRLKPFDDLAFRRAAAQLVPREAIIQNIFKGYAEPADSHVSVAIPFWHNPDLPQYEFDMEQARQILLDAGYTWDEQGQLHHPCEE